jgi:hypothetical protein
MIEIAGWDCPRCRVFNGEEKAKIDRCRACDYPKALLEQLDAFDRDVYDNVLVRAAGNEIRALLAKERCGRVFKRLADGADVLCILPLYHEQACTFRLDPPTPPSKNDPSV